MSTSVNESNAVSLLPALLLTSCSGSSLLAALPITYLSPSTHSLTALLPRRIRVFEAREPAHVAHAQLAAAAHEQRVVGSVAHRVEHLLAVAWGAVGVMVGARTRRGGRGESAGSRQCVHAYGVITGVLGSCAPGEGMVSTGTPRETASHMVSLPLEQMTPVHFEKSS